MSVTRGVCSVIVQAREPVFVGYRVFRYRYSLFQLENRFRQTEIQQIRVSRVAAQQLVGKPCGDQLYSYVKGRAIYGTSAAYSSVLRDSKCPQHCAKIHTLTMSESKPFERLPKSVVPKHYDLKLKPDLKTFIFEGQETVNVEVIEATDKIILNSLDLDIRSVKYTSSNGNILSPLNSSTSVEDETLTLSFGEPIPVGEGSLEFHFTGELKDKMKGFYRSKYVSPDGEERYAGVTQFEATDARRCFPCWDEPAVKATFDITLRVPQSKTALSNMPVVSEHIEADSGLRTVKFETTPIMSTYLVALIVGEYDYVEDKSSDGVLVRVYTPVGKREQGRFALHVATKVLPYYKDYFQIAYPLPKIDLIAIADFSGGAMENWGLITYRETCLLVDPKNTSTIQKQWIALTVGHEIAHQWFGNLVTMEWWTHLWLNEGYASFVEFLCVDYLFPEYDIWTQFVADSYIPALELDCLTSSHPIEVPVGHPSEIDEIFDDISYGKGASVIRMLHKYIGDKDFRKGMNLYLTRHQYSNTFTEDLWSALEEASNKPVRAVMSTWTKLKGFPVVKVTSEQVGNDRKLVITQQKFCADGSSDSFRRDVDVICGLLGNYTASCGNGCLWMIPVMFSTSKKPEEVVHYTVLETRSSEVTLKNIAPQEWIKLNPGTVGFYRTQYPPEMLVQFVAAIREKSLPPLDRLGLLDDLFALVQAGHTPTVEVLKLMEAFSNEDNFTVWSTINNCIGNLSILLSHTDYDDLFNAYVRRLMQRVSARLGWDSLANESHLDKLLRPLVIGRLGRFGDEAIIAEAQKRFEAHVSGKALIPADLRSPVYKTVLTVGDESTYNTMLKLYREDDLHEEKNRISQAFGAIRDEAILKKVLQFALSDEVRSQDSVHVIASVAVNKHGRRLAWNFFKENWKEVMNRYPGGFLLSRLVKHTTENFASEEDAEEIEAFFRDHPSPGTERTVQQSCETVRLNAAWLQRDCETTREYLISGM